MANSDLLADAIADAKNVKRTALANAKLALEEAFQPTLQRMISTKLAEEDEDDPFLDINIDIEPETAEEPAEEPIGMGSFEGEDETPDEEEPAEEPADEGDDDLELESLIRELEGEDEFSFEDEDELGEGQEEDWDDPIQEEDEYDDTELTVEESRALASLFEEEGLGDIDGPEDEDGGSYTEDVPSTSLNTENRRLRRENRRLKSKVSEALRVVTSLKKTINEVNLLNAKLMFTTKAIRTPNLSESQQVRIMESIDRATTVREVKLVYTSLMEALNRGKTKRSLSEGLASKPTKAITKNRLSESKDSNIVKWQRLAGILPPADF